MANRNLKTLASILFAAVVAVSCGGGDSSGPKSNVSAVSVYGDSLADSGTFGLKFTVQTGDSVVIWPELVAAQFGKTICPHFGPTLAVASASCTNYAVGGGRINNLTASSAPTNTAGSPFSIVTQMQARAAAGAIPSSELILVDGGGNDAADLIGAYLGATTTAGAATYQAALGTLLPPASLAVLAQPNGGATAGGLYMQALADKFTTAITTNLLNNGASKVAVLNMPPVALTPRFQMVLQSVAASSGAATSAAVASLADTWTQAFNARLASNLSGKSGVVVVDFYTSFKNEVNTPAQFGLVNVTTPVCNATGVDSSGLPSYDFAQCTVAKIEAGKTPGWWKYYAFSDSFHPTPYGHQLLSQAVSVALSQAGWL